MKSRKLFFSGLAVATILAACNNETKTTGETTSITDSVAEATYTINTDSTSQVTYAGTMVGVYTHTGTLKFTNGSLKTKGTQITGGDFTVDMSSITPTDDNYKPKEGKTPEKLKGHLSSADFFDVANYPTASFTITSVNGNEAKGIMKIRGKENEETVKNITVAQDGDMIKATGELTFDRKKYDVMFDMAGQEMVVSNDVKLDLVITAKKQ